MEYGNPDSRGPRTQSAIARIVRDDAILWPELPVNSNYYITMNNPRSSATPSKPTKLTQSKAPLVPPAKVEREKSKLKQGRERLEDEASNADTSVRTSVIGDRLNTP